MLVIKLSLIHILKIKEGKGRKKVRITERKHVTLYILDQFIKNYKLKLLNQKKDYITKKGEDKSVDLVYNKENNTWNAVADGQSFELVKMNEDGTAVLSLQNGTSMTVTPDAQGIATARIATGNSLFFAAR